jgi:hypothetical protein
MPQFQTSPQYFEVDLAIREREAIMPIWTVRATWFEDDAEVSKAWEVSADTAQDAVKEAAKHFRFAPHHVEAKKPATPTAGQGEGSDNISGSVRRESD